MAAFWENLSAPAACEERGGGGGGGVCWAGGAGGVAAWRGVGVGVAAFGMASGVTGDGAGLLEVNTPFYKNTFKKSITFFFRVNTTVSKKDCYL